MEGEVQRPIPAPTGDGDGGALDFKDDEDKIRLESHARRAFCHLEP
mgnify:CR=1 FL=1